ncbi:hypothetical protein [uncultured Microbacterium sp.]|uniref:hypothetical protein n=1 Tax=uncultured Microbacterium sp. TaxID=191216 RepID=UPI0026081A37|nr:hypothetical protein [uncultured Microbacterium sp.]
MPNRTIVPAESVLDRYYKAAAQVATIVSVTQDWDGTVEQEVAATALAEALAEFRAATSELRGEPRELRRPSTVAEPGEALEPLGLDL